MKVKITEGAGWYKDMVGEVFDVYEISDVGDSENPETGYVIDPPDGWQRYISEFNCEIKTK